MFGFRALLSQLAGVLALFVLTAGCAAHAEFDEGFDYHAFTLPKDAEPPETILVQEFFWYGCPHCDRIEPYVNALLADLPKGVAFQRIPAALNPRWELHARAYYAAQSLGVVERTHAAMFDAIHRQRRRLNDRDALAAFYAEHGVDQAAFKSHLGSFDMDFQIRRAKRDANRYQVSSVPTFIVAGKYTTGPGVTGSNQRTMDVVRYLIDKELKALNAGR